VSVEPDLVVIALVLVAAVTGIGFWQGRRVNRRLALMVSRELERSLEPQDSTYTWIGGFIGFHARYDLAPPVREARATCTLLPRQAPAYLPLAWLLGRSDRVHVTLYLHDGFACEAHMVDRSVLRSPLGHIRGREGMHEARVRVAGRAFVLLASSERVLSSLEDLARRLDRSPLGGHVRHLAFVPDLGTLYAQVVARRGAVEGVSRLLRDDGTRIVGISSPTPGS
jgi:hypothetical protein